MNVYRIENNERIHTDIDKLVATSTPAKLGRYIAGGCYAVVYARRGMARERVIKITPCIVSREYLRLCSKISNPHFPKNIEDLGIIGYVKRSRYNAEKSSWESFDSPVYAISYERLKPVVWTTGSMWSEMQDQTDWYLTGGGDPCQNIDGALEALENNSVQLPASLFEAFRILKSVAKKLGKKYGKGSVGLDLHSENYLMRGKDTLVINDPFAYEGYPS